MKAIVFDTNVFGHGLPNVAVIERWAGICEEHGAELWLPEIVAAELAQHVVQKAAEFKSAVDAHNRQRRNWGLAPVTVPDAFSADDVIEIFEEAGTLIPVSGEAAVEALLDQVMQRGAGSRKKEIKTGAADSAWIRSVIAHNGGDGVGLVVVTGDVTALERTCELLGIAQPRTVRNLGELAGELSDEAAPPEVAEQFSTWVQTNLDNSESGVDWVHDAAGLSYHHWWDVGLTEYHLEWERQETYLSIRRPTEVLEGVAYDSWSRSTTARVRIHLEVEEQYARQDRIIGDSVEYEVVTYDAALEATLTLYRSATGELEGPGTLDDVDLLEPDTDTFVRQMLL